jgi:hypothetical protein
MDLNNTRLDMNELDLLAPSSSRGSAPGVPTCRGNPVLSAEY